MKEDERKEFGSYRTFADICYGWRGIGHVLDKIFDAVKRSGDDVISFDLAVLTSVASSTLLWQSSYHK